MGFADLDATNTFLLGRSPSVLPKTRSEVGIYTYFDIRDTALSWPYNVTISRVGFEFFCFSATRYSGNYLYLYHALHNAAFPPRVCTEVDGQISFVAALEIWEVGFGRDCHVFSYRSDVPVVNRVLCGAGAGRGVSSNLKSGAAS